MLAILSLGLREEFKMLRGGTGALVVTEGRAGGGDATRLVSCVGITSSSSPSSPFSLSFWAELSWLSAVSVSSSDSSALAMAGVAERPETERSIGGVSLSSAPSSAPKLASLLPMVLGVAAEKVTFAPYSPGDFSFCDSSWLNATNSARFIVSPWPIVLISLLVVVTSSSLPLLRDFLRLLERLAWLMAATSSSPSAPLISLADSLAGDGTATPSKMFFKSIVLAVSSLTSMVSSCS
mmetsp:Transcript_16037/g.46046  ORF Transcript_16037/g.46046 Transcript_16037/m.46046 type:complete len:237 (+) Transcript_16037:2881-3591(+)